MTDLGSLDGNNSYTAAVSTDGSVIVGWAKTGNGRRSGHVVSWVNGATSPTDLGTLGGNKSNPGAVSADGGVIVGNADLTDGDTHAVSWVNGSTTATDLGTLGGTESDAYAVSADGSVIVGFAATTSGANHAARWVNGSTTATDLGNLGGNNGGALGVSADGRVIVGIAATTSGHSHAASWVNGATSPADLGTLGGTNSFAKAVSADGSVIIGNSDLSSGDSHAVSWVNGATSPTDLGTLGGGSSSANAVNADGSVIVGNANLTSGDAHAASWVNGSTTATDLGTLGGNYSFALGVSADGSVIVGFAATTSGANHAALWVNGATSPTDLGTLGGDYSDAQAVSADGGVIVGYAGTTSGDSHAFIVKTGFAIQDKQNLVESFGRLANETSVAVAGQQVALSGLLGTDCAATEGANSCFATSGNLLGTGANGGIGSQSAGVSQITAGHAVSANLTVGASLALGRVQQTGSAFAGSTQTAVSLWSNYSQNGSFSTGLMAHAAIGTAQGSQTINRGVGFDNVVVSTGTADLTSSAVQASLSYGVQAEGGWQLTPMAGLTWMETSRGAYSEATGVFPASFDKLTTQSSYSTLGMSAQRPIDARSNVSLSAGADIDLSADHISLSGTSDLPGMTSFTVTDSLSRNKVRPYVVAGYSYSLSAHAKVGGSLQVAAPVYGNTAQVNLGVKYAISF